MDFILDDPFFLFVKVHFFIFLLSSALEFKFFSKLYSDTFHNIASLSILFEVDIISLRTSRSYGCILGRNTETTHDVIGIPFRSGFDAYFSSYWKSRCALFFDHRQMPFEMQNKSVGLLQNKASQMEYYEFLSN